MSDEYFCSLTDMSIASAMTPPLRRVPLETSSDDVIFSSNSYRFVRRSIDQINDHSTNIRRERSSSRTSSSSKSSTNDSFESFPSNPSSLQDDDDDDDDEDTNQQWNFNQLESPLSSRQQMNTDSHSLSIDNPIDGPQRRECDICLEELSIDGLFCCSSSICSKCLYLHLSTKINEGSIRIACPSCSHIFIREEILWLLTSRDDDGIIAERYKRFYANINGEAHIKTCPRCCSIKEMKKDSLHRRPWKRRIPRKVHCEECQLEWCFLCHAPWHEKMSCKEYQRGEKMFRLWASQIDHNQHNAQKCPRCKVYISRNGGCPHMVCSKCQCDFCYNCGKRRLEWKFVGSHESRYSPLGCKYNLYPSKPILRHTVRGLITGVATLAVPVAVVGAVAVLALGTTIAAPTYGTYRLVKHIQSKRRERQRRRQMERISRQWTTTSESLSTSVQENDERNVEGVEIEKAIEASLVTFREEIHRREQRQMTPDSIRDLHSNFHDDDDDSFNE